MEYEIKAAQAREKPDQAARNAEYAHKVADEL